MDPALLLRQLLLYLMLIISSSLLIGAVTMLLHGLLISRRKNDRQPISECITQRTWGLLGAAGFLTLLLLTQAHMVPWSWLGTVFLLVAIAPAMLSWLGPPEEHVEASNICQIGKGSAYGHYYGYLRLMEGKNGTRKRLENFKVTNPAGLSKDKLKAFYSRAVVVLAPMNGEYPSSGFEDLKGISKRECVVPSFDCTVGGNRRSYGGFGVYEVTKSSNNSKHYVALDRIGALATLQKLQNHRPAGLKTSDCEKQMKDLVDELKVIVKSTPHLRGQLILVQYDAKDHVGDAIMAAIEHGDDRSVDLIDM